MQRISAAILVLALCCLAPGPAGAQARSLVGSWRCSVTITSPYPLAVTMSMIFGGRGEFSELDQSAIGMTRETGTWRSLGQNLIRINIEDWEPKSMYRPGEGYVPVRKPPSAIDRVRFSSPTTMTLQDTTLGGAAPAVARHSSLDKTAKR